MTAIKSAADVRRDTAATGGVAMTLEHREAALPHLIDGDDALRRYL